MNKSEIIKARRLELGLSLQEVADRMGVSKQTVSKYETGVISNIPYESIIGLANALQDSPAYLMGWEDKDTIYSEGRYSGVTADHEYIGNISREEVEKTYQDLSRLPREAIEEYYSITQYLINKYSKKE